MKQFYVEYLSFIIYISLFKGANNIAEVSKLSVLEILLL